MPLSPGTRLGAYEIVSPLGAGGMGEVYRAKDSRLGREVAIKVLPESVAQDADRLARFEREARTLAALNHPNIVTIFAVEESGGTRFLAMELVEGESLANLVAAGGLTLSQFFEITVPLAEALSAAHERGIVHRDLKPGNVMVTPERRVKVLDFGLAKLETQGSNPNLTNTPTESGANLTGEGQVFGTVAYMSPEQARGGKVDARSDVFSLGVMLYELLTGERPFQGESSVDLISSILRDKPPSVTDLRADLPPHLARILRRCLEKDPRDRYQTSRDVYNELKELRAEASTSSVSSPRSGSRSGVRLQSGSVRAGEGFWVAVLPFQTQTAGAEVESFADGLAEDITTGLSRFRYLSVVARASTERVKDRTGDARTLAAELGARYAVEGSVRKAGSAIRVSARLLDAQAGAQLWAGTYDRDIQALGIFEVQDDVAARIVATVADSYGVLVRSMSAALQHKADAELSPSDWLFQYFAYRGQLTPPAHAALKTRLERAVQRDAGQSDLWACLAQMYTDEYTFGFPGEAAPLDRALAAARRAVELDRTNQLALVSLAQVYFFRQDVPAFRTAAEQAMAANRLNTDALGILGLQIVHTGEFQRGAAIVRRAMELNPNHAGWFHFGPIWEHFERGEYERALDHAMQVNMPSMFWQPLVIAAICGQLGRRTEGAAAIRDLLALDPEFGKRGRTAVEVWHFASGLLDRILEGVQKAGLDVGVEQAPSTPKDHSSGAIRADEGFWVAVLPFKYGGGNADLASLAEGLSEEIVTGLSRFSYLRVITSGKDLGARYVMSGNLRQAGARLRVAIQLVDATSGAHLWAETYERNFTSEAVFELQDELVPRIVSTVADMHGVLPRSMAEAVRSRPLDQLSPYEAVLRSFGYFDRVTTEELAAARSALEMAVRKAPDYADAWAMLALLSAQEFGQGFHLLPDPLGSGATAAQRAVEAGPSNHLAHCGLAQVLFLRKEYQAFRNAASRATALNPMDGFTLAIMGILWAYSGDWERGCAMVEGAMRLNPHFPGWYRLASIVNAYRTGDYRAAIDAALRIQMPGYFWTPVLCAAAFGQLGEREAARKAVGELLAIRPEFGSAAREEFGKWHDPELVEHFIDGLRKAGLAIPDGAESNPATGTARDESVAIAVLPFSDMSPARDQEYLCEGMAEEIMNALVRIEGIRIASRSSAFRAGREGGDLASIARALSVGHVLEGSVRTSGGRLRVTAQLTEAASGYQLWSERFDRDAADVFAVQDEIAAGVVEAVKARLGPGARAVQARPQPPNLEAYRSYLKGRHLRGIEDHAGAFRAFEEAVRLDPSHAPSWTGLAELTVLSALFGLIPVREACASAREALAKAAKLQGESAEALHVEAFAAFLERRWEPMETAWRRALELEPRHILALGSFGLTLCARQKVEEGLALFERAREADPLASFPYTLTAWGLLVSRRPQEALRYAEDALTFEKEDASAICASALANVALGNLEEGIAAGERGVAVSHRGPVFLGTLGWALATAGRHDEARAILEEMRSRPAGTPTNVSEAWLLGALGEIDDAFAALARAEEQYQGLLCYTGLPGFDPLRSDPRFAALLRRLELSPERGEGR